MSGRIEDLVLELARRALAEDILFLAVSDHGNLAVPSSLKDDGPTQFEDMIGQRRHEATYGGRMVRIEVTADRTHAEYIVEDEGAGFDYARLPDPHHPSGLLEVSGRGLLIIRLTMHEVSWNARGNRIRMVWRPVRHQN